MKTEVSIIFSESWLTADIDDINEFLTQTINEFIKENDRIINIERVVSPSGYSRFWIYIESEIGNE